MRPQTTSGRWSRNRIEHLRGYWLTYLRQASGDTTTGFTLFSVGFLRHECFKRESLRVSTVCVTSMSLLREVSVFKMHRSSSRLFSSVISLHGFTCHSYTHYLKIYPSTYLRIYFPLDLSFYLSITLSQEVEVCGYSCRLACVNTSRQQDSTYT